jgi:hypothetical protein
MKIGILTVHRAINMGAVLQSYALQEVLRSLGHEVWIINYIQEKVERTDRFKWTGKVFWRLLLHGHLRSVFYFTKSKKEQNSSINIFDNFITHYLHCTKPCDDKHIPQDFDTYVVGSDQLWNSNIFGYPEQVFWGNFCRPQTSSLVAYAPSTSVKNLKEYSHSFIQSALNRFDLLSVREKTVSEYLNQNFQLRIPVDVVLDPTLAVNPEVWHRIHCNRYEGKKYIFVYGARPCPGQNSNALYLQGKQLADKMGLSIVTLDLHRHSPIDFLDMVKHATYVVTSSFHGVVFSLIYNRPLYAVKYGDEQDARYADLLEAVGASQMLVDLNMELTNQSIDYELINSKLAEMRIPSINYLKQMEYGK